LQSFACAPLSLAYANGINRNQNGISNSPYIGESIMKQLVKYFSAMFFAVALVSVTGCASTAKHEGTGEYVDDSVITTKVKTAIFNEPTLKVNEINVETFKGVVQLSGFVGSQAAANKAVEMARGVAGVKSVKNDIRLK
jgi:hyperosmotically inducible protein